MMMMMIRTHKNWEKYCVGEGIGGQQQGWNQQHARSGDQNIFSQKILDKRKTIKRKPRRCTLLKERRRNIKKDIFSDHTYLRCKISKIT